MLKIFPLIQCVLNRLAKNIFHEIPRVQPCEKLVKDRLCLHLTFLKPLVWRELRKLLFDCEKLVTVPLADQCAGILWLLLGAGFQGFVKLTPCVSPASHHYDVFRQTVVCGITVGMEIAAPSAKKIFRMLLFAAGLVLKQNNGHGRIPACPIKPHVAFGLCRFAKFSEHLKCGLIGVENFMGQKLLFSAS